MKLLVNMKFISLLLVLACILFGCHEKTVREILEKDPSYNVMLTFSKKIRPETGLILRSYGLNHVSKDYKSKNGVANFSISYSLTKNRGDKVSIEEARNLLVFIAENFLKTVNSDQKVIPMLDVYPLTSDLLKISLHFEEENRVDLGQGVAIVYFNHGKVKYQRFDIWDYTGKYPALGKHFLIHEESYADALEKISKKAVY
jgi:hypothetical protein